METIQYNKKEGEKMKIGFLHPVTVFINEISLAFRDLGFSICEGRELEDEYHNFDALNVAKFHPSRDMQDTFYIKDMPEKVMRSHTSNVEILAMEHLLKEGGKPPFAIVSPGKVFRNEATDAYHEVQFFQFEGLCVGKDISVANLKWVLEEAFKRVLSPQAKVRFRPSYFPFVEPGFEVDVWNGKRWLEVLGAGMCHPHVLRSCGIDPNEYQGFAFGMGIDRLASLRYEFRDIRDLYTGDMRLTYSLIPKNHYEA